MSEEYVAVLGTVGLMRDGVLHSPQAPLLRALLGLVAAAQAPLSPEYLMGVLWRHDPPHAPRSALHLAMSRLRNYLRANGTQVGIATTDAGYRLDADRTDLVLFREWTAGSGASFESLSKALALWRGRPFANVPGKRCDSRLVDALLSERDAVTIRAARAAMDQGSPAAAVALAEPLCHAESLDEAAHAILIEALVAAGRQGAAALVYDGIRRRLATELGIGPGTLLRQAHLACLDEPPQHDRRGAGALRTRRPGPDHLLGRQEELARMAELLAEHRVVTVIGPPGVGKASFAARFAADAAGSGFAGVRHLRLTADGPAPEAVPEPENAMLVIDSGPCASGRVRGVVEQLIRERRPQAVLVAAARPLGISGEVIWALRPLDPAPAELLFRRRAGEAVPGLVLSAREQPYVRELCRQADGLPAVVESLASLLRTFPLRELARHAAADLGALVDGANPSAVRFTAGLDLVWRELITPQRAMLLRLTGLRRDFALEDIGADWVEETGGPGTPRPVEWGTVLNSLAALVDRGLVLPFEARAGRRYRLLCPIRAMIAHRYAEPVALTAVRPRDGTPRPALT
ncbi:AfsR/SARP family transcriptional regulator [Nonomuraea sp. LPB2021202275-12-8]|uniref:AfsR/SARP family transcriptional regulator n=1 Tax=Nonomuraea sp. LPB2021202275-12-8 TaxID=3120159 RepID=UPI00300C03BE